jgi:hypothetical protein
MASPKSPTLEEIAAKTDALVKSIRDYARSQQELWRKVPWLALEADGRGSYNSTYALAYSRGFWNLYEAVRDDCDRVVVDLATGELLDAEVAYEEPFEQSRKAYGFAAAEDVLPLALAMESLDAQALINSLEKELNASRASQCNEPLAQREWREKTRKKYHVQEDYVRQPRKGA